MGFNKSQAKKFRLEWQKGEGFKCLHQGLTSSNFYTKSSNLEMAENSIRKTPFERCCSYVTDIVIGAWTDKMMEMRMKNKVGWERDLDSLLMNFKQERES